MTTGDVVYSLRFSLIKILPEPGFDLGSTAGESCVLTARLHMLYNVSLKRSICPLFLRFLMHSYYNQEMRIKWNSALSGTFNTSNRVKQGSVLSPLLFTIYLDQLILSLKDLGVGCHLNGMFVGAFSYADDVTLLAPTNMALSYVKFMYRVCSITQVVI